MTHSQACRPCAKRKVRCNRLEPCSNCKRRKTDRCTYPASTPTDRIRQLESLVRELGGNPSKGQPTSPAENAPRVETQLAGVDAPIELRSNDPVILEEDGEIQYLESRAWQGWRGKIDGNRESRSQRTSFKSRSRPHAMTGLVFNRMTAITPTEPLPIQRTIILWQVFTQRIEPLVRIMYRWVVEDLRTRSTSMELQTSLTPAERALIMAVCYTSVNSLTNDECRSMLQLERATLLTECRFQCEDALVHTNMFCMTDLNVIRAVVFYIMGSFDRVSTHSLWSLLGMTIRNAEKLGLHRDGAVLGLSPMATEERRRLWWQLQHLDLGAAVRMGLTPMTLTAGWDVKMPLNIEDEDLYASSTTAPPEKRGLTSLSYNLFTYWVLDQQRQNFLSKHGRFELSWLTNSAMSSTTKDDMLSLLEDGVNRHFVQFCDPINPLHVLLQLLTRSFITNMQLRVMHGRACTQGDSEHRTILLNASMQSLRYHIALMSQTSLSCYQWLTRVWFSWQAFMVVLVEASDTSNVVKAQELWDLLASVYASNADMFDLADDRRRLQAAEHVVAAWKAYPGRFDGQLLRQPPFILEVAQRLTTHRAGLDPGSMQPDYTPQEYKEEVLETPAEMPEGTFFDAEFDFEFDMELQDIDWSFWSSID